MLYCNMEKKTCTKCNIEKTIECFNKQKMGKNGLRPTCKICQSIDGKQYREKPENKEKIRIHRKIYNKNNTENKSISYKNYYKNNYEKESKRKKKYREDNPEKIKEMGRIYRNKPETKEKQNKWRKNNPHNIACRTILNSYLRRVNKKKEGHTIDLLGYSALDLKNNITSLFTDGMSWDNYGEWHIDHIKTVISFDKGTHPSIVNALNNLQPLWATTREINGVIYEGNLNRPK